MASGSPFSRAALVLLIAAQFVAATFSHADIVINEVVAGASDRLLQWDSSGVPHLGAGTPWQAAAFNDGTWATGQAPFGYGTFAGTAPTINTNVSSRMLNLTPTLYLRKSFTVAASDAASTAQLQLNVTYNDGFVAYLNGVEIGRRWAGPANEFIYHDQPAYNPNSANTSSEPTTQYTASLVLGAANNLLKAGANILTIQGLNWAISGNNFLLQPSLVIVGGTTLVTTTDTWKYFAGIVEPSGAFYDPALLGSGRLNVPWGVASYDDSTWISAVSPLRVGQTGTGTIIPSANVTGVASTIYSRTVFSVTSTQAADTLPMQLLVDYNDAFIAYINGVEVARANVGAANTFTPYSAVASSTRKNTGTETDYTIDAPAALLTSGTNVLSIQIVNVAVNDSDMSARFDLENNAGTLLMASGAACKYFIGTQEPVVADASGGGADYGNTPDAPDSAVDWVELYNTGTAAVSLNGWSLTDDSKTPAEWVFPSVSIPAGGYLVVICDGLNVTTPPAGGYLHTNFSLAKSGEFLGLYNASGAAVQVFTPTLPPAQPFYSYGRDANGNYGYFDTPTPGTANSGNEYAGQTAAPTFSLAGGFYSSAQTVTLSSTTASATIRYTTDGSEPTVTTGTLYGGGISVSGQLAIRAKAFATGMTPSATVTTTYLVNQSAALQTLPALCINADQGRTLYRPDGVMAIYNNLSGNYSGGLWTANGDPTQYNNGNVDGECLERPASVELYYPGTPPTGYGSVKTDFGLRITGSAYTAPRFLLTSQNNVPPNGGTWTDPTSGDTSTQKPSFDLYFRSDYGTSPLATPLFPGSPVNSFHDIRLRAGHNDANPFVHDELIRRLFVDMGQVGSLGFITSLYVDGVYKGYFDLCEHLREDFFQQSYNSTKNWDVRQVTQIVSGDGIAFQDMLTFIRNSPQGTLANYQAMQAKLDMNNFCDYLLLNVECATQDWPTNNYIVSREHSSTGIHHFHVWDAEFSFGNISGNVTSNSFTGISQPIYESNASSDANITDSIMVLYSLLKVSPEFRLKFADRVEKQMFNGGALTEARILARWNTLKNQMAPFLPSVNDYVTNWENGTSSLPSRRQVLFGYTNSSGSAVQGNLVGEGLWPATVAPTMSQFGGAIASGYALTLGNPNSVGTIYYTLDGSDPRLVGGAVHGTTYNGAIPITQTTSVQARVLNTNGEWSPLAAAVFTVSQAPALAITELMYHPPLVGTNTTEDEFLEIKNTGTTSVNLSGMQFTSGITYTFPAGSTLAAGGFAVLVKDPTQFAARYPNVAVAGVYTDSLSNTGETVTLADINGSTVYSVTYSNVSPWPVLPDGYGNSLVPVSANANPDPNNPVNWRASAALGGSPGADDPTPTTPAVEVNEVLANSLAPQTDMVELYNPISTAADISGWFLSDSTTTPEKFKIPAGTVLPAGGYVVYSEADFNPTPGGGTSFAFDANGEQVRLSAADASGNLTGYSDGFTFGASAPGVSFGRYVNSVGAVSYPAQVSQTFGAANAGPLVGPVVITELMYHPVSTGDEFVEIQNVSKQTVALYDPANPTDTWKVDGVGFSFPTGTAIAPGQIMLVVPLTPTAWRTKYGTPAAVQVFGPYTGKQNNSGDRIAVQKPGVPYTDPTSGTTTVPYIDVDYVNYLPTAPWPTAANGNGPSLERINLTAFGDDPGNWRASPANGGSPGLLPAFTYAGWSSSHFTAAQLANAAISGPNADPDGDGISNLMEYALGLDPLNGNVLPGAVSLAYNGSNGPFLTLTYRRNASTSGVTFYGDTTATLPNWSLGSAVQVGTATNNGDGTETVVLQDTVPITKSAPQRFIRLRVVEN